MHASCCALRGLEGHVQSNVYTRKSRIHSSLTLQAAQTVRKIHSVVVLDFRDEVYGSIAHMMEQAGLVTYRAEDAIELAGNLVRHAPDLVLLNETQPDENAWLTSAKLRIIDANRPVWIYSPKPPSALNKWLSMVSTRDVIVYGGVLHRLLDLLQDRLSMMDNPLNYEDEGSIRRIAA